MNNCDLRYSDFVNGGGCSCSCYCKPCSTPICSGPTGPTGPPGTTIKGSYETLDALEAAHPTGNPGDAYLVGGVLYAWNPVTRRWENVGNLTSPFLSSFLEASGSAQSIAANGDIAFDTDPDFIEIVGTGIAVNAAGTIFTITRPGLYHVEWSINLATAGAVTTVGLLENGEGSTILSNTQSSGNLSAGGLIFVSNSTPYVIRLRNYGDPITIADSLNFLDSAASIRILRFADGPS